jgi:hypothetical protein
MELQGNLGERYRTHLLIDVRGQHREFNEDGKRPHVHVLVVVIADGCNKAVLLKKKGTHARY